VYIGVSKERPGAVLSAPTEPDQTISGVTAMAETILTDGDRVRLTNLRGWVAHYEKMVTGVRMELAAPECSTPIEDTAALRRVLEIFEGRRGEFAKAEIDLSQAGNAVPRG
jgi:hypothetical protein